MLAGHKTQYRAPVLTSEQVSAGFKHITQLVPSEAIFCKYEGVQFTRENSVIVECPFGKVGDRLWVQEPTLAIEDVGWLGPVYVASTEGQHAIDWGYGPYDDPAHIPACDLTYNRSCDLSYEESRMLLEITDIRMERVRDVTHNDSVDEGCFNFAGYERFVPLSAFISYWMAKHGDDAWWDNPWIWVIEFKVIKENNDD